MTQERAGLIFELLRQMRAELCDVRSELGQIRADFAAKSDDYDAMALRACPALRRLNAARSHGGIG